MPRALVDFARQQARAAHAARAHAAAEGQLGAAAQGFVQQRSRAVGGEGHAIVGRAAQVDPEAPVHRALLAQLRQLHATARRLRLAHHVLDAVLLVLDVRARVQAQARETVGLHHRAEILGLAQELVEVRHDLVLRDRQRLLALRRQAERAGRLQDEVTHAAIVGGVKDRLELRDVETRDDDLVGHADAHTERLGETVQNGETLERLEQGRAVVADRIDVELSLYVGGVQRDVEVLEAGPQDLQREGGIDEGAKVRRHAEAGEADALRQLDVLEQLRVDGRLAAGEEQHVELPVRLEDELARRVGVRHQSIAGVELLAAEEAVAVAGSRAENVHDAQILVPRPAFRLVAEPQGLPIGRVELGEQRLRVDALRQQTRQAVAPSGCRRRKTRRSAAGDAVERFRRIAHQQLQSVRGTVAARLDENAQRRALAAFEKDEAAIGELEHGVIQGQAADAGVVQVERDQARRAVDPRRHSLTRRARGDRIVAEGRRARHTALGVRQESGDDLVLARPARRGAQGVRHADQDPADRLVRLLAPAAAIHQQEIEMVGVGDAERRAAVAANGDAGGAVFGVAQHQRRSPAAHRTERLDPPAQADGGTLSVGSQQIPRRILGDRRARLRRLGVAAGGVAQAARGFGEHLVAELVAQRRRAAVLHQGLEIHEEMRTGSGDRDPCPALVLRGGAFERVAAIEIGVKADRLAHAAPSGRAGSQSSA